MRREFNRSLIQMSVVCLGMAVTGCNMLNRLSEVGGGPQVSELTNPTARPGYRPVSMPMPAPRTAERQANSLWRAGARAFFRDQRAGEVGDILTVKLSIDDNAKLDNKTERTRDDTEAAGIQGLFGFERKIAGLLPGGKESPDNAANIGAKNNLEAGFSSDHTTKGVGTLERNEEISVLIAAVVTQILPNGNMVVYGRQEIKVNAELREIMVAGVVRPQDIDYTNTIDDEKIAELRVAYGGRGTLSDLQQPRWGTQVIDVIFPF